MIAAISPSIFNFDETWSTLRYASRAKSIKNKPKINEDPKDALLKQYEEEIRLLKELLEKQKSGISTGIDALQLKQQLSNDNLVMGRNEEGEESVDQLIQKLARKGTKVEIIGSKEGKRKKISPK